MNVQRPSSSRDNSFDEDGPANLSLMLQSDEMRQNFLQVQQQPQHLPALPISSEALKAIDAIEYIAEHLKQDEEYKKVL